MTATPRGNVLNPHLAMRLMIAMVLATLAIGALSIRTADAQSGGCAGGPYDGATALDSDGDGINDGDEVQAGTDQCDPNSTPPSICGSLAANYDASTADTDGDGHTDAAEVTAGSDPCDANSKVAGTTATTAAAPPRLALTGPSTAFLGALVGLATLLLGLATLAIGRRVDA